MLICSQTDMDSNLDITAYHLSNTGLLDSLSLSFLICKMGKPYPAACFSNLISLGQNLTSVHQQTFISYAPTQSSAGEGEKGQAQQGLGRVIIVPILETICEVNDGPRWKGKWHGKYREYP